MNKSEIDITPVLLTPAQVATFLSLPVGTVYDLAAKGILPRIKIGKAVRIPKDDLERWLAEQKQLAGLS